MNDLNLQNPQFLKRLRRVNLSNGIYLKIKERRKLIVLWSNNDLLDNQQIWCVLNHVPKDNLTTLEDLSRYIDNLCN
jgi:hypothetical protein